MSIGAARFLAAVTLASASLIAAAGDAYVGSDSCRGCHTDAWDHWRKSHHYQAMLPATDESVLGDFNDSSFEYAGLKHRFFRREGRFMVETDNAQGQLQEFEINYVFGFFPLQQYLIGFPDGRYQALGIAWDSRPGKQGGQRWYHLYPDESATHDDILHWTGSFQNWNSRCASCHSTELRKNYTAANNSYQTRWAEINVACEACHGPGAEHVNWAQGKAGDASTDPGFSNAFGGGATWVADDERPTKKKQGEAGGHTQVEVCAACHSRRTELDEQHAGRGYADLFQLRLLEEGMYYPDGQILDEVYVYGSFLQSRMYLSGVVCTNCHEPHSGQLRLEGNALCGQCHQAGVFDTPVHHHHPEGSSGAACVNCHMPVTTYMGVDERRDHSFRVPEPSLTAELNIPNACNRCHQDRDAAWAQQAVAEWYPESGTRAEQAWVLNTARQGNATALPGLIELAKDPSRPAILRATAALESGRFPSQEMVASSQALLENPDPLVRAAAVSSLEWLPLANRYTLLQPLISDPARSVRIEVARVLADLSPGQLSANGQGELIALREEYLKTLQLNADMPETQLNLGSFLARSGQTSEAERAYRQALKLSPAFVPAMINLADLYRAAGMDGEARKLLQSAIEAAPEAAPAHFAMALLLVRDRQMEAAVGQLQKAAELDPLNAHYAYVYAVALYELGQRERAVSVLETALEQHPGDPELVSALRAYYQQLEATDKLEALEASQGM